MSTLATIPYYVPASKLKTQTQKSGRPQRNDVCRDQSLKQLSHKPINNRVPSPSVTLPQRTESDKQDFSTNVRFLLVDLENRMNRTSKAMLHILEPLMTSELIMIKDLRQFKKIQSNERLRIFLFTSAEYADKLGKILNGVEKIFVLGTSVNRTYKTFENIEDLIFQVAEEFAQWYRKEADQHDRLGEFSLAECKHKTISEMYRQLMDISTGNSLSNL